MEVCMSKTRRGKYTDNRICYISKCKGDMRLYLRRKGKLPCFSYLVRGKSFSFYRGKIRIKYRNTKEIKRNPHFQESFLPSANTAVMPAKKQNRGFEALFLIHFSRIPLIINTLYHFSRVVIYKC